MGNGRNTGYSGATWFHTKSGSQDDVDPSVCSDLRNVPPYRRVTGNLTKGTAQARSVAASISLTCRFCPMQSFGLIGILPMRRVRVLMALRGRSDSLTGFR